MEDEETKTPEGAAPKLDETEKQADPVDEAKAEVGDGTDSSMLEAAVTALERLTETVETLGVLAEGDAKTAIGEIATELRALADQLVEATGATPEQAPAADAPPADQLAMMMASVRTTLEQVGSLIDRSKRASAEPKTKDEGDADKSEKREPAAAVTPAPAIDDPLRKDLAALTQAVTKLADGVREQQQRLSKLEKGFGLPNSAATREQGGRPDAEDVGWPLDLNRPFDRESVDKAVSFHDL